MAILNPIFDLNAWNKIRMKCPQTRLELFCLLVNFRNNFCGVTCKIANIRNSLKSQLFKNLYQYEKEILINNNKISTE